MKTIVYLSLVMLLVTSCEKNYTCVCNTVETKESAVVTNYSITGSSKAHAETNCKAYNSNNESYFAPTTSCKLN